MRDSDEVLERVEGRETSVEGKVRPGGLPFQGAGTGGLVPRALPSARLVER